MEVGTLSIVLIIGVFQGAICRVIATIKPAPNSSYLLKHGKEGLVGADSKNRRSSNTRKDVGNN